MDFMKIIKSLELVLYELMVWLVFYPLTLVRALFQPLKLMEYADKELGDEDDDRYSDTLSPPIFLAITLGLLHGIEMVGQLDTGYDGLLADDEKLIAFRLVAFAIFPLMFSIRYLRSSKIALDRKTLRSPFYAQCFAVGPFAFGIDTASILDGFNVGTFISIGTMIVALAWYLCVQVMWFHHKLEQSFTKAMGNTLRAFLEGLVAVAFLSAIAVSI